MLFRVWGASEGGGVIALFPTLPGTQDPESCESYEHVGQHGAADFQGMLHRTRRARPEEYAELAAELREIGYVLDIRERATRDMHEERRRAARS